MALRVGELYAALSLNQDAFRKGLDSSQAGARGWAGKVGGVFKSAGKVIAAGLAVGVAAITAIGIKSIGNALEQEQANARVAKAFGESADAVNEWAGQNARALGVADDALQASVARYGEWAQNVGVSTEEAAAQGQALARRASEISLATGRDFQEVFDALLKGSQGSTRGLKEFGVAISPLAIQNEALRLGLVESGEALSDQARAAAINSIIMSQTAGFTESAAGAQGNLADMTRKAGVMVDEVMDTIGELFMELALVILPPVLDAFGRLVDWVQANMPTIRAVVEGVVAGLGAAFGWVAEHVVPLLAAAFDWIVQNVVPALTGALEGTGKSGGALDTLGKAFAFITDTVIPAFAGVFTWLIETLLPVARSNLEVFTTVILPALGRAFEGVQAWIRDNWPLISKIVEQVGEAVRAAFGVVAEVIKAVAPLIVRIGEVVFPIVGAAATKLLEAISLAFEAIGIVWEGARTAAETIVEAISGAWGGLTGTFRRLWRDIEATFRASANVLIDIVNTIIRAFNTVTGQAVPELRRLGEAPPPPDFDPRGGRDQGAIPPPSWVIPPPIRRPIPKLSVGLAYVPGPMLAQLHRGEAVLRRDEAEAWRRGAEGTRGISTGDIVFQVQQMNASEAEARAFARRLWDYLQDESVRRGRTFGPVRGGAR